MDTTFFYINWGRVAELMITIMILAFILERALSLIFEHRAYIKRYNNKGLKEPIAFLVAFAVCRIWHFDAISLILLRDRTNLLGEIITGGIVAGGSKASVQLFREIMKIKSTAAKDQEEIDKMKKTKLQCQDSG